ncbi:hypothetical protein OCU04_006074 [Sclerotinia nivalis]|uniref:Uncharacterized protein n=1 Tax=Sclerotinia nivalis TaxID=352851 RepID=A0A9X0DK64_9HELO|nr:hypothetical protein OCU04_006074 [Sclerotinia nivalis]
MICCLKPFECLTVVNGIFLQDTTPEAARNFQWKKKRKLVKPITHIGFFKCPCAYAEKAIQEMNSVEIDGRTICVGRPSRSQMHLEAPPSFNNSHSGHRSNGRTSMTRLSRASLAAMECCGR